MARPTGILCKKNLCSSIPAFPFLILLHSQLAQSVISAVFLFLYPSHTTEVLRNNNMPHLEFSSTLLSAPPCIFLNNSVILKYNHMHPKAPELMNPRPFQLLFRYARSEYLFEAIVVSNSFINTHFICDSTFLPLPPTNSLYQCNIRRLILYPAQQDHICHSLHNFLFQFRI